MKGPIVVVGSLNMDVVIGVQRHPRPGETVLGGDYATYPGGKGANQAVAAARTAAQDREVIMLGRVGNDDFGRVLKTNLAECSVNISLLEATDSPSGVALITVDAQGQNMIVVSPGANGKLLPEHLPADLLKHAAVVLLQLEIPLQTVQSVTETAADKGVPIILNPAPAQPLSDQLLRKVSYLIVNESEAAELSGVAVGSGEDEDKEQVKEQARAAALRLRQRGVETVIVTLGAAGSIWSSSETVGFQPAFEVDAVDTTAAGDAYCGAFTAAVAEGVALPQAIRFAAAAGALACTAKGAQPSLPARAQIEHFLESRS